MLRGATGSEGATDYDKLVPPNLVLPFMMPLARLLLHMYYNINRHMLPADLYFAELLTPFHTSAACLTLSMNASKLVNISSKYGRSDAFLKKLSVPHSLNAIKITARQAPG